MQCDAHLRLPCKNCRDATCGCSLKGPGPPHLNGRSITPRGPPRPSIRGAATDSTSAARRRPAADAAGAISARASSSHTLNTPYTRATPSSHAAAETTAYITSRSAAIASQQVLRRAREAERERSRARADSRRSTSAVDRAPAGNGDGAGPRCASPPQAPNIPHAVAKPTARPVGMATASPALSSGVSAPLRTPVRALDAERAPRHIMTDVRRTQEQKDKIIDLEARLTLETRARAAAEEQSLLAYDQGHKDGVRVGELRARAKFSAMNRALPSWSVLEQMRSLPSKYPMMTINEQLADNAYHTQYEIAQSTPQTCLSGSPYGDQHSLRHSPVKSLKTQGVQSTDTENDATSGPLLTSSPSLSRVDPSADPHLRRLREKAPASTAFVRDRLAAED